MFKHNLPGQPRPRRSRPGIALARRGGAFCSAVAILAGLALWSGTAVGQNFEAPQGGVSSRAAREEATRAIPLQQLSPPVQARVLDVVTHPSIYRRMPAKTIECDPELYQFLVLNPEIVVNIWELMGITQVRLQRISPTALTAADGAGTECTAHVVHSSRDLHVIYADGFYEGPLFRNRLHGACVLLLRSAYGVDEQGDSLVTCQLDVFLKVENAGVDLLAKTLTPLVGKSADSNFVESAAFLGKISQAAEANGPGVQRLASSLVRVDPEVRVQFSDLAATISDRAALRAVATPSPHEPASTVVQRAIDEGVTPFGKPLEASYLPAPGRPDPPRRGITLRR
jgi:hypothetical protein